MLARSSAFLCCLLLPFALTSAWLASVVTDTDRYVATVGPLAEDDEVRAAVADRLEQAALDLVDVQGRGEAIARLLGRDLPTSRLEGAVATAVRQSTERVLAGPVFAEAWRTANRSAHQQALSVLESDGPVSLTGGRVSIDLGQVLVEVLSSMATQGLVDTGTAPETPLRVGLFRSDDLERAQLGYQAIDAAGYRLPLVWLALLALTLAVARDRRRALGWLGWGSLAGALLLAATLVLARMVAVARAPGSGNEELVGAIWDVVLARLWLGVWVAVGAAVAVLALRLLLPRPTV